MDDNSNEIEALDVQFIRPEALGEPGQRRFRIVVVINGRTVIAWMEKDQVRRLAALLSEIIARLPVEPQSPGPVMDNVIPDEGTRYQFRAGRMELNYDQEDDRIVVIIHDIEADDDGPPSLSFRLTRGQTREFSGIAEELMTTGRPSCPLCGRPMGPGPHVCEKQNGHIRAEA